MQRKLNLPAPRWSIIGDPIADVLSSHRIVYLQHGHACSIGDDRRCDEENKFFFDSASSSVMVADDRRCSQELGFHK